VVLVNKVMKRQNPQNLEFLIYNLVSLLDTGVHPALVVKKTCRMQICVYNKVITSRKNMNLLDKLTAKQLITKSRTLDATGKLIAVSITDSHLTQPSTHLIEFTIIPFKILILSSTHFLQICRRKLSKLEHYSLLGYCCIDW